MNHCQVVGFEVTRQLPIHFPVHKDTPLTALLATPLIPYRPFARFPLLGLLLSDTSLHYREIYRK